MKNKNIFTYAIIAGIVVVALITLLQSVNAPTTDTANVQESESYI
jgi:hypothetical protein